MTQEKQPPPQAIKPHLVTELLAVATGKDAVLLGPRPHQKFVMYDFISLI